MKKILISLFIFNLISFDIYGESYTIPLTYQVAPTYTVTIPKAVDVSRMQTSFSFSVSGDIYYDNYLEVVFIDKATITNGKNTCSINVSQNKSDFDYDDLVNKTSGVVTLSHDELTSGTYSGELNISITLKEGA